MKSLAQQKRDLSKKLKEIGASLSEVDKMALAVQAQLGLSTVRGYLKGDITKIHTAENIITKAKELFPAVAA